MAAMLSRSGVRVFASAAKDNKPRASVNRVVPKASLNDAPKQFIETGAEAPMPTGSLSMTTTPFDNYAFAPIREATVSSAAAVALLPVDVDQSCASITGCVGVAKHVGLAAGSSFVLALYCKTNFTRCCCS
jgi:hypothetical protein